LPTQPTAQNAFENNVKRTVSDCETDRTGTLCYRFEKLESVDVSYPHNEREIVELCRKTLILVALALIAAIVLCSCG